MMIFVFFMQELSINLTVKLIFLNLYDFDDIQIYFSALICFLSIYHMFDGFIFVKYFDNI